MEQASTGVGVPNPEIRRVALASFVGTAIEWYDFFIYSTAAQLVFASQFFTDLSPAAAGLASFATIGVSFIARPLGGVVMGHFGDLLGRRTMLVVSLLLMGIATVGVGLLPTYTQIGLGAPVLLVLLRLLQGLSAGGEWGGAALMAVEHAPRHRRGLFGAFPQLGAPAGLVLANAVFFLVTFSTTDDQFAAWGWRLPFLFSAVMIAIGFFIRARVSESPEFTRLKDARERAKSPLSEVLREHRGPFLIAAGVFIANNMVGYIFLAYILGYATAELDVGQDAMLLVVVTGALSWVGTTLLAARWSDAVGRRRVYLVGSLWIIGWAFPFFLLLDTGSIPVMLPSVLMLSVGLGLTYGPQAALYAELFPSRVRYSGASFSYAIGAVLGGGFAPFVAASLQASTGTSMSVSAYMAAVGLVSLVAVLYIPETPDQVRERRAAGGTVTR
ncbi:metabolite-proton symporter [Spinactinospora alkalitolerans]|uniref:Putative proline/betaine transporter n=1 Tax=Spinactinospora alkalitolerans TaxID=687207 RepID=A0A852TUE8_9ACTN|nr:MFS transporter [Spinactinospora alkalitolerans]NYE48066.1 metabolite-proton symporter [Spinactinospora alkalitolerans]